MTGEILLFDGTALPPPCEKEILRYSAAGGDTEETKALLRRCLAALPHDTFCYRVCTAELPLRAVTQEVTDLGFAVWKSRDLARYLAGCERILLFAATVGTGIDRLVLRHGRTSPATALLYSAIGTERVEALCDAFCKKMAERYENNTLKPRFSPGYGDLPLSVQADVFRVLGCAQKIGLTLGAGGLMSPTKSVTAIVAIK
ncbi:MAG: hypothetical protein IJW51_01400 [Clostridia bacterium]|nr:hypothetical protein [Clostridia bacterium]